MTSCGPCGPTGDAGVDDGAGVEATQPRRWRHGCASMAAVGRGQSATYVRLVTWQIACLFRLVSYPVYTSISANADGPRDAASRKIDHIALHTMYNHLAATAVA